MAGFVEAVVTLLGPAGGVHDGAERRHHEVRGIGRGHMRVAPQVAVGKDIVPERPDVLGSEPVSPVVAVASELRWAAFGFEFAGVRVEAEVAAADGELALGGAEPIAGTVADVVSAGGAIDPSVESPAEAVGAELLVAFEESADEDGPLVRLAIAVGVAQPEDLGSGGDDHAVAPGDEAGREAEAFGEHRGLVGATVTVGVPQDPDPAARFAAAVEAHRVIGHLDDPGVAGDVPVDRDGVEHERFGGDEVDGESVRHMDPGEGFAGRERLGSRGGGRRRWCGRSLGRREARRLEVRGDLGGWEDAVVDGDFIEAAFETEKTVGAPAEEEGSAGGGGDLAEGSVDLGFGLAVEVDAEAVSVADEGDVVPGLGEESGPAGKDLVVWVAIEQEEAPGELG